MEEGERSGRQKEEEEEEAVATRAGESDGAHER